MLEDKNPVDWVQKRLCCGPEFISLALMERVKSDVEKVNFRSARMTRFKVTGNSERFCVECEDRELVCFMRGIEQITITGTSDSSDRIVTWKWNPQEVECDLFLDGQPTEFWKVSQTALYCKFFPKG